MQEYSDSFYKDRHEKTVYSAGVIISHLMEMFPHITSAVDVGCGVGTWLSVLKDRGVETILGIDGEWVEEKLLAIPSDCFKSHDLSRPFDLGRRFDLAISLEVAEHLPARKARTFVNTLVRLADIILFSAAIPGQGGLKHVNEQWPDYWAEMFKAEKYEVKDLLRAKIWNDDGIPFWYRQNTLLFVKEEKAPDLISTNRISGEIPMSIVHPDLYTFKIHSDLSARESLKLFLKSLKSAVKRRLISSSK